MAKQEQKARTKQAIVTHAARRFRRDGIAAVGLRPLVADAGVTHGAFYAHFPTRDTLVAEAVGAALSDTFASLSSWVDKAAAADRLAVFINAYLHDRHVPAVEHGCAVAALAPEIARASGEVQAAYATSVAPIVTLLAALLPNGGTPAARQQRARVLFASMVGTLQLARLTGEADRAPFLTEARAAALASAQRPWAE